ncbi:MAG: DUF2804 domain-containing protein [Spirochaetaceae bacterium]|nr:DUF2804 domain-containing protein [Spirochaetaceae bacterium]
MSNSSQRRPLAGDAPDLLYENGRFSFGKWQGIPGRANLRDAKNPYSCFLLNFFKNSRLKEWQALQVGDREWFLCAILYNAKTLSMVSIDLWDRKKQQHYSFRHVSPGSHIKFKDSLYPSDVTFVNSNSSLSVYIHPEQARLRLEASCMPRNETPIMLDIEMSLAEGDCLPFSVCLPFSKERALYSTKMLMHCHGKVQAGEASHSFNPSDSLAILDDHKGYYPYRLHYDWVTAFGILPDHRIAGFNLTDNQVRDQKTYNENRLWLGSEIYPLPPVKITHPYGHEGAWIIQDTEGMVDMSFYPEVAHDIKVKLGLAEIDYAGPFGRFEGTIRSTAGDEIDVSLLYGMGEDKNLRL